MSRSPHSSDGARVYAIDGNLAVVHLPGRKFPAIAVQGDTLHTLVAQVEEIYAAVVASDRDGDIVDEVNDLVTRLRAIGVFYEVVLRENGIAIPYTRSPGSAG